MTTATSGKSTKSRNGRAKKSKPQNGPANGKATEAVPTLPPRRASFYAPAYALHARDVPVRPVMRSDEIEIAPRVGSLVAVEDRNNVTGQRKISKIEEAKYSYVGAQMSDAMYALSGWESLLHPVLWILGDEQPAEKAWAVITDGEITDIELDLDDAYEVEKKRRRRRNGHKPETRVEQLVCYWPCQLHS